MEGAILNRQLSAHKSGVQFAVAEQTHDAGIRRLLRENPTRGNISLSFTREPDYFADAHGHFGDKQTIVAVRDERVICVGSCVTRTCFVNGEVRRVGYLGGLRLDASVSGQSSILRRGYELFRELQSDAPADFYFTSIASDNVRARHFLEAGIPGMPKYECMGEYVTLVLPTNGKVSSRLETSCAPSKSDFLKFLNDHNCQLQFAPYWTEEDLAGLKKFGLGSNAHSVRIGGELTACAELWDQRSFKQTVIHDYSPALRTARPLINFLSPLLRQPYLPPVGAPLDHAYISCLGWQDTRSLLAMVTDVIARAAQAKIQFVVAGFAANSLAVNAVSRAFKCRKYRSRMYVVRWPDCGGSADQLDHRPIGPDVALL
jgi:hypothetical protein